MRILVTMRSVGLGKQLVWQDRGPTISPEGTATLRFRMCAGSGREALHLYVQVRARIEGGQIGLDSLPCS